MRLDHVIYGTRYLEQTAAAFEREHGLTFRRGGRHPGGTINMVAPLEPPQYLELLAVERIGDPESRHLAALIDGGRSRRV